VNAPALSVAAYSFLARLDAFQNLSDAAFRVFSALVILSVVGRYPGVLAALGGIGFSLVSHDVSRSRRLSILVVSALSLAAQWFILYRVTGL
jgi:hypothetical protein